MTRPAPPPELTLSAGPDGQLTLTPTPRRARLGSLQVEVAAPEQGSVDELARQVANEVLRQVARLG